MKRLLVILSIISLFHSFAFAQKKEISQAQTYVKTGKNLDKAEASMRKLLSRYGTLLQKLSVCNMNRPTSNSISNRNSTRLLYST